MRPAYAIEYVCIDPRALLLLEVRDIPGLYGAGQFAAPGLQEAAAQVYGRNAARRYITAGGFKPQRATSD